MSSQAQNIPAAQPDPAWLTQAKVQGLLPPGTALEPDASRPWPVVLLTAFGAWLAGLPLLGFIALAAGDFLTRNPGSFIVLGAVFVAASLVVLRAKDLPLFLEQFAVPGLWAGTAAMAWGFSQYMAPLVWAGLLALLLLAIAVLLPGASRAWLRLLLGAACAVLLLYALTAYGHRYNSVAGADRTTLLSPWLAVHGLAIAWALWHLRGLQMLSRSRPSRWAADLPAFAGGWVVAVLAALAWVSGPSFVAGGADGVAMEMNHTWGRPAWFASGGVRSAVSATLVALGAWRMVTWFAALSAGMPTQARLQASVASLGVAAVLVVLAWFMPTLGAVLLIAALALRTQRYTLASFAVLVTTWIVGSFYYHLTWPLATKAVVLVCAAAVLAALAWWAHSSRQSAAVANTDVATRAPSWGRPALLMAAALATLGVANTAIWQKEQLIAEGQPVFVRLAPRDPRSLMQGDYMALNFAMHRPEPNLSLTGAQRPFAVGKLAANGELALTRTALPGETIHAGEVKIELSPKSGNWTLVTDAWFFKEGEAQRWEQARYGEFRVTPNGRALLVGMADEKLRAIKP